MSQQNGNGVKIITIVLLILIPLIGFMGNRIAVGFDDHTGIRHDCKMGSEDVRKESQAADKDIVESIGELKDVVNDVKEGQAVFKKEYHIEQKYMRKGIDDIKQAIKDIAK